MKRKLFFHLVVVFVLYCVLLYLFDIPFIDIAYAQEPPYDIQEELLKGKREFEKFDKMVEALSKEQPAEEMAEKASESLSEEPQEESSIVPLLKFVSVLILMMVFVR